MMEIISHLLAISEVLVLVSLLYNLWRVRIVSNKNNGILRPEPSGALPIIGHIHKFLGKIPMFRTMAAMADKHGPTLMFRFGMKRALVISNHEAVKECFTTNDKAFASRPMSSHGKYLVYDYAAFGFAPYGTYWREMRKLVMIELLSSRHLETLKSMSL
uniref:Cytochrome P450 n=1 Tax=Quercus lobata TaxID=97700 RepID=A0A7N2MLR7_QUELO